MYQYTEMRMIYLFYYSTSYWSSNLFIKSKQADKRDATDVNLELLEDEPLQIERKKCTTREKELKLQEELKMDKW